MSPGPMWLTTAAFAVTTTLGPKSDLEGFLADHAADPVLDVTLVGGVGWTIGRQVWTGRTVTFRGDEGTRLLRREANADDAFIEASSTTLTFVGLTLDAHGGPGIHGTGVALTLDDVELRDAKRGEQANGTALHLTNGSFHATSVYVSMVGDGGRPLYGGIAFLDAVDDVVIDQSTFAGGQARYGGQLALVDCTAEVTASWFERGVADGPAADDGYGGAWYVSDGSVHAVDTTFAQPTADAFGGAVAALSGARVSFDGGTFDGGKAREGGHLFADRALVSLSGGTWSDGDAEEGGSLHVNGGRTTIVGGTFRTNAADDAGGAVWMSGNATVEVDGATFDANHAPEGGAVYADGASLGVVAATFHANDAETGGAVQFRSGSTTMTGVQFLENVAHRQGSSLRGTGTGLYAATHNLHCGGEGEDAVSLETTGATSLTNETYAYDAGTDAVLTLASPGQVRNLLVWGNAGVTLRDVDATVAYLGAAADPGVGSDFVLVDDPRWAPGADCDPARFWLGVGSPAIDAGDPDLPADPDGSPVDLGWTGGSDDADLDGVPTLDDCDDRDPTAGALEPEVCDDGDDNDCDGLTDADDPDDCPAGTGPTTQAGTPPDPGCGCAGPTAPSVAWLVAALVVRRVNRRR